MGYTAFMSWLEHSQPREVDVDAAQEFVDNLQEHAMGFTKVIASRQKTIVMLETRIAEYRRMFEKASPGVEQKAVQALIDVDESRLARVRAELDVFQRMAADPRQLDVPGTSKVPRK